MQRFFCVFFLYHALLLLVSCQSTPSVQTGIQKNYQGINPASILAMYPLFFPSPYAPESAIDNAILKAEHISSLLQEATLKAFQNQPHIHGYSFEATSKILQKTNSKSAESIPEQMETFLKTTTQRLSSPNLRERLLLNQSCLQHKNIITFYEYCLQSSPTWKNLLTQLSLQGFNADSVLLTWVTDLQSNVVNQKYTHQIEITSLLIDTSNARIIWISTAHPSIQNAPSNSTFPSWKTFIQDTLSASYWNAFPGRIS